MRDRLSRLFRFWWFPTLVGAVILIVFEKPFFSGLTLFSPDSSPFFPLDFRSRAFEYFWGMWDERMLGIGYRGIPFQPVLTLALVFPALIYHISAYVVALLLQVTAAFYFLRGRGLRGVSARLPALALAFSGYVFTLISAGHRSMFEVMAFGVFLLAFIDRAIVRRSMFHFCAASSVVAFGLAVQPDVMVILCGLAATYGSFRFVREWLLAAEGRLRFCWKMLLGGALALVFFALFSTAAIGNIFGNILPRRESVRGTTPEAQWEFATNWSLPPEDMLELVAPCIYGIETSDPNGPYWGRLGQTLRWPETKQGFRNFRQHTVYIGGMQLFFGLFALAWALRRKKSILGKSEADSDPSGSLAVVSDDGVPGAGDMACHRLAMERRNDIVFWGGVFLVSLMLALGRYFPLYKAFYAIPWASKIRCPVKFLHVTEIAVCFLFAAGLSLFLSYVRDWLRIRRAAGLSNERQEKKSKKAMKPDKGEKRQLVMTSDIEANAGWRRFVVFACLAFLFAGALFCLMAIARSCESGVLGAYWRGLGFAANSTLMMQVMTGALVHGGLVFIAMGVIFVVPLLFLKFLPSEHLLSAFIAVVLCADLVSVDKRYVRVRDLHLFYADNPIAEHVKANDKLGRTSYFLSSRSKFDPVWRNFRIHGVDLLEERSDERLKEDCRAFFGSVASNPLRMWALTNTRFVVGSSKNMDRLRRHPDFETEFEFNVSNKGFERVVSGGQNLLLRYKRALPRALVYHSWDVIDDAAALATLASPQWSPESNVLVSTGIEPRQAENGWSAASINVYKRTRIEIETDIPEEGVLLLNDRHDPDWRVQVDGIDAELLRCNYIMRGVHLPAGKHKVVFTYRPYLVPFLLTLLASAILIVWAVLRLLHLRRRNDIDVRHRT